MARDESFTWDFHMTALDRVDISQFASLGIPKNILQQILNRAVWEWYREHQNDVLLTKRVFFFSITLKIKDVRFLIERIAGAETL